MRPLADHLAEYAAHHRKPRTKLSHVLGVPAIVLAVLALLSLGRFSVGGLEVNLAAVFVVAMLAWYLWLDPVVGLMLALLVAPLLALAEGIARQPWPAALGIAASLFVGGWVLQLIGHRHEGNRPAFLHNLSHLLYAPAFLAAELLFAVGLKQGLREEIEGRIATHAAPGARPVRAVGGTRQRR